MQAIRLAVCLAFVGGCSNDALQGNPVPEPGSITGRICDRTTGNWVAGITVSTQLGDGSIVSAEAAADRTFTLGGLEAGRYDVHLENTAGFRKNFPAVEVTIGGTTQIGDTVCNPPDPPGSLTGAVCDTSTGSWIPNLTVTVDYTSQATTTTDAGGVYLFEDLPPGPYAVAVHLPGGVVDVFGAIVVSGQTVDVGPSTCDKVIVPPDCSVGGPVADVGRDRIASVGQSVDLGDPTSIDPSLRYRWRVRSKPPGSMTSIFLATFPFANITPDTVGDYEVCLTVTDSSGCEDEDCLTIVVKAEPDFRIAMEWNTNQSDIDLHYLQPGGTWFDQPSSFSASCVTGTDTYYRCLRPDWGPSGPDMDAMNDPRLDVDNTEGLGPENVNQDFLWDSGPYTIGVHYYENKGSGPTVPTVRVYMYGVLQFERQGPALTCGQLWKVAEVTVSGSGTLVNVTLIDTIDSWNSEASCY